LSSITGANLVKVSIVFGGSISVPSKYINLGKPPQRFQAKVQVVSGDGSIIQTWDYRKCDISFYKQYFDESRLSLAFSGKFQSEIRERTTFECGGLNFDGTTYPAENPQTESITYLDFVPKSDDRAVKYAVHFSGGDIPTAFSSFTYSKFEPKFPQSLGPAKNQPYIPTLNLEGLATKDKQKILMGLETHINAKKIPEPFDVTVDVLTGDNTILQQWKYKKCKVIDMDFKPEKSLLVYKIHGGEDKEYRDSFEMECNGLSLDFSLRQPDYAVPDLEKIYTNPHQRVTSIFIHMQDGEIENTWSSFELPYFETGSVNKFSLTGLPNKSFFPLMEFFSRYMNPGKAPEPINIIVDIVAGDGDRVASLKFDKCRFTGGYLYYDDSIATLKIRPQISPEMKGKGEATCSGIQSQQVFATLLVFQQLGL